MLGPSRKWQRWRYAFDLTLFYLTIGGGQVGSRFAQLRLAQRVNRTAAYEAGTRPPVIIGLEALLQSPNALAARERSALPVVAHVEATSGVLSKYGEVDAFFAISGTVVSVVQRKGGKASR